jgi:MarR family transcriptional regulator for hemolysin
LYVSRQSTPPIGLHVTRVAKTLSRAFDRALSDAGGSQPAWLILLSVKSGRAATQRELAGAVGIEGATLTHHLDGMERAGLITRRRDPENRRVQRVKLTAAGEEAFQRMRRAAMAYDRRLRAGLSEEDLEGFRRVLERLGENGG